MRILAIAALLCTLALGAAQAQSTPISEEAFTAKVVQALRAEGVQGEIRVAGPLSLEIIGEDDAADQVIFLTNAYLKYEAAPETLDEVVSKYVRVFASVDRAAEAPIERSRIVPIIKPQSWVAHTQQVMRAQQGEDAPPIYAEPFAGELVIVYAVDYPDRIAYPPLAELEEYEIARADLRAAAVENLGKLLPEVRIEPAGSLYLVVADENYETSLLLFDALWQGLGAEFSGDVIVAAPARGILLVADGAAPEAVAQLRDVARKTYREYPYPVTEQLFIRVGGAFQHFDR